MRTAQRGQVAPIFGIMLVFVIGVVALAIDFGLLSNQHRNLQQYADQAALAGVQQLNPTGTLTQAAVAQAAARKAAFIYLRENLAGGSGTTQLPISTLTAGTFATCWGSATTIFTADISQCALPAPFTAYTVTICTPGETVGTGTGCAQQAGQQFDTLSVRISEIVSTTLIRALGIKTENATGYAEAQFSAANQTGSGAATQAANVPFAFYTSGCLTTGNQREIVQGDVYIGQCSLNEQSSGQAGFCAEGTSNNAGNLVFGPDATVPIPAPTDHQSLSTCVNASGGAIDVMGQTVHLTVPIATPQFLPPPGYDDFNPNNNYSSAQANNLCYNNTVAADGSTPSDCFNPGYYTTIGGIANNLNPGVYYVTGDAACTANTSTTSCDGVNFSGDTMNANWIDVQDSCWASPNNPNGGVFTSPCPDGFAVDPTSSGMTDSQCTGSSFSALAPPAFTVSASNAAGSLDPVGTGTTYYVRVTAINAFGESASTEASALVSQATNKHSLTVNVTSESGATGYRVYVSTASGSELQYGGQVSSGTTSVTGNGAGTPYPHFNTSSCTGFRNIPKSSDPSQNNGVTFVLFDKASFCANPNCANPSGKPTVMLSPYCSTERFNLPVSAPDVAVAAPPGISAGTGCVPPYAASGPYMNDGAFVLYGPTQGLVGTAGNGSTLALVGTIYTPSANFSVTSNAVLEVIPGQVIARSANIQTGNTLNPSVYFPCCAGGSTSLTNRLVGAAQPPRLHLIR
jgi:Flp pilus assembly protein TadG